MINQELTDDELQFITLAIEYWQDKEELINPSIDYVVDVNRLIEKLEDFKKEVSEARKAVHEASLSIACLGASWTEHFEDESVTKNHKKWVLKDQEGLQQDLDHIQNQITILENYLDPYIPKEETNV